MCKLLIGTVIVFSLTSCASSAHYDTCALARYVFCPVDEGVSGNEKEKEDVSERFEELLYGDGV